MELYVLVELFKRHCEPIKFHSALGQASELQKPAISLGLPDL